MPRWFYRKGLIPLSMAHHQTGERIRGQVWCLLGSPPVVPFVKLWVRLVQTWELSLRAGSWYGAAELELEMWKSSSAGGRESSSELSLFVVVFASRFSAE